MDLGILADNEGINPKGLGILQAGLGMLAAGGPSRMPVSLGQAVGQAGQQGMNAYQQAIVQQRQLQQLAMQKALQDAQIKKYTADAAKDEQETETRKAEAAYFARPEVQSLLKEGRFNEVLSGLPRMSAANLASLVSVAQRAQGRFAPAGNGILNTATGEVLPNLEAKDTKPLIEPRFPVGDDKIQPHISTDNGKTWVPVPGSKPMAAFARQVGPSVTVASPVTPVTIQDPNNPNETVVIDGRTRQVLGKGPKLTETGRDNQKLSMATKQDQANAVKALKAAGYDPLTGKDKISELIEQSTSGFAQRIGAEGLAAVNVATPGRKALNTVQSAANTIVMDMMGGKLGAGISNADREFIVSQLGDVGNANKTSEERLAAWNYAKNRMIEVGLLPQRGATQTTPTVPEPKKLSSADQQALDWANMNPKDPRAKTIKERLGR